MKNFKGVIFDLDGTLIDSMHIWEQIDVEYLGALNISVPKNLKDDITHLSFKDTAIYFKERFNIEDSIESIMNKWHTMAHNHYSNTINLKPGVIEYLKYLKDNNIKIGLATSNSIPLIEAVLQQHNIQDYFHSITTTEEAKKSKDNPDIYLLACKKLNLSPSECIVFEDIPAAIIGAKKANIYTVAIYDKSSIHLKDELIALSDKYINDYYELL